MGIPVSIRVPLSVQKGDATHLPQTRQPSLRGVAKVLGVKVRRRADRSRLPSGSRFRFGLGPFVALSLTHATLAYPYRHLHLQH
jgi:hypothetical protein